MRKNALLYSPHPTLSLRRGLWRFALNGYNEFCKEAIDFIKRSKSKPKELMPQTLQSSNLSAEKTVKRIIYLTPSNNYNLFNNTPVCQSALEKLRTK
jgi:hypothetical protein